VKEHAMKLESQADARRFHAPTTTSLRSATVRHARGDGTVPPGAQGAHQQALHMYRQIRRRLAGKPLQEYRYRDFGSLVSLGRFGTVGNMMGALVGRNFLVEAHSLA